MYKKNNLVATSALIALALSNSHLTVVKATDNERIVNNEQYVDNTNLITKETNIENKSPQEISSTEQADDQTNGVLDSPFTDPKSQSNKNTMKLLKEEMNNILSQEQFGKFETIITDNEIRTVLYEALNNHEKLEFNLAKEKYLEVLNYLKNHNKNDNIFLITFLYNQSVKNVDLEMSLELFEEPIEKIKETKIKDESDTLKIEKKVESPGSEKIKIKARKLSADDYYQQFQDARQASDAWEIAQNFKRDYPNDNRLQEVVMNAATRNLILGKDAHLKSEFNMSLMYYTRILSESMVQGSLRNEVIVYQRQASNNESIKTADVYYQGARDARQATDAWELAQKFKRDYPNDNRLQETITNAAMRSLILGQDAHQIKDFDLAIVYYNRILNESLINDEIRTEVNRYQLQASNKETLKTANNYYQLVIDAGQASEAWEIAQQFKRDYPNDSRLDEAINRAGERNLILGKNAHVINDLNLAINYYERLINEPIIKNDLRSEAKRHHKQASNGEKFRTADDYYQEFLKISQASPAWELGQRFKQDYPEDNRVREVINSAAERNMILGLDAHGEEKFELAEFYYSRIVNENLVVNDISNLAKGYYNQATTNRKLVTPDEYFDKSISAFQASDSWNLVQSFKRDFPNHPLFLPALKATANRNFKLGVSSHNSGSYSLASVYYSRIINEPLIDLNLRNMATTFNGKAQNNAGLNTAEYYRNLSVRARGASDAWNIALEGLVVHPNNVMIIEALNEAANRNVYLGRENQRNGNNDMARNYYTKIIGDERVDFSIRNMAKIFRQQLNSSHSPVIYIDPGHGGDDPGASFYGVRERDLNLNVSSILKNELEARGYTVVLSRNTNVFIELEDRAKEANRLGADIFISVHHNSMGGGGTARGIETFIHHRISSGFGQETNRNNFEMNDIRIKESLLLADYIHNDLIRSTGMNNRGVKGNNYSVLRNTDIPAVLLELGFMDNRTESSIIKQVTYQTKASKAIADGIDKYFKGI